MTGELVKYASLLEEIKEHIRRAQTRAVLSANREMLALYWEVGRLIRSRQEIEGWGAGVLRRLATDLKSDLPGVKGFSERNLKRMTQFHRAYPDLFEIGPTAVAQLSDGEARSPKGPTALALLAGAENEDPGEDLRQLVGRLTVGFAFVGHIVDDLLRHEHDKPSIGLILCQDKKRILAEYALRGVDKPIGVSEYELTRALPERLKSALPTIEEIEAELSETGKDDTYDFDS